MHASSWCSSLSSNVGLQALAVSWKRTGLAGIVYLIFLPHIFHLTPLSCSARALTAKPRDTTDKVSAPSTPGKEVDIDIDVNSLQETHAGKGRSIRDLRVSRTSPPFVLSHDVPRGVAFAFQALLAYILMLAVMWVLRRITHVYS